MGAAMSAWFMPAWLVSGWVVGTGGSASATPALKIVDTIAIANRMTSTPNEAANITATAESYWFSRIMPEG